MKTYLSKTMIVVVMIIPLVYLAFVYNQLPPVVATHFDLYGKPNDYSDKSTLVLMITVLVLVNAGVYLLLKNIHRIDPKKSAGRSKEAIAKIASGIMILLTAIGILMTYSALNNGFSIDKVMLPLLGLFFTYMGNLMFNVKPNYFVGIRTPWALENEETWRKTHQLAGKMFFAGGLIITLCALIFPSPYSMEIFISIVMIITLVPAVFSYIYYKRIQQ